jgi:hypothetical protein
MCTVEEIKERLEHAREFQSSMKLLGTSILGTAMGYSMDMGEYVAGIFLAMSVVFYIYAWNKERHCKRELSIV